MTITYLGAKRLQGLKVDRKSDSLGSSADGTNTGISTTGSHSGGTAGSDDVSGIDVIGCDPRGGWGQQIKTGHPLVGAKLKTITVTQRLASNIANRSDQDTKCVVFAGHSATLRGQSAVINTSTLTTAGTWYETTYTFSSPPTIQADDMICVISDNNMGTSGGWNCKIKGSPEDTNKGYWVAFNDATYPDSGQVQTNRSMIYTATYDLDNKLGSGCYSFDGSSSRVAMDIGTICAGATNEYTIAFWLKGYFDYTSTNAADNNCFFDLSGSNSVQFFKHNSNSVNWKLNFDSGDDLILTGGNAAVPNDGKFHHICITRNSSSLYTVYVDGVSKGSVTNTLNINGGNSQNLTLGSYADYFDDEQWDGEIDDVGVWSRVLTATEIGKLVNNNDPAISFSNYTGTSSVDLSATTSSRLGTLIGDSGKFDTVKVELRVVGSHTSSNVVKLIVVKKSDNSVLATSNTKTIADLTGGSTKTEYTFTFASPVTVTAGDYYLFCEYPHGDASDYLGLGRSASGVSNYPWTSNSASGSSYTENTGQSMKAVISGTGGSAQLVSSLSNKSGLKAHYTMDTALPITAPTSQITTADTGQKITNGATQFRRLDLNDSAYGISGTTGLDSTWTIRCVFDTTAITLPTDNAYKTRMVALGLASDQVAVDANTDRIQWGYRIWDSNGGDEPDNIWGYDQRNSGHGFGIKKFTNNLVPSVSKYFIEVNRLTATSLKITIRTDSHTGDIVRQETFTGEASGVTDLRYLSFYEYFEGGTNNGTFTTIIGDVEIWNGSTTASGTADVTITGHNFDCNNDASTTSDLDAMTNLPENTIFEQTDTPLYYWKQSDNTWKLDGTTHYINTFDSDAGTAIVQNNQTIGWDSTNKYIKKVTDGTTGTSGSAWYIDLGELGDKFIMRFRNYAVGSYTEGGNSHHRIMVQNKKPTTNGNEASCMAIGYRWYYGTQQWSGEYLKGIEPRVVDGSSHNGLHSNTQSHQRLGNGGKGDRSPDTSGQATYMEFKWDKSTGEFTFTSYTDSTYTTVQSTAMVSDSGSYTHWNEGTPENITGLRYFLFTTSSDSYHGTGTIVLDNLEFQKGVSTWIE